MFQLSILRPSAIRAVTPSLLLAVAGACSSSTTTGSDTSFPAEPLQTMACEPNNLHIEVRTAPTQPPPAGLDGVEVLLTDPTSGAPVDGADVTLVPWMPLMGHGADLTPIVKAMGKGRYVLTNVNLYMPGEWQLRFQFSTGKAGSSGTCSAAPTFDVP